MAVAQILSTIVGGIVGIVAAERGAQYWALVLFTIVGDGVFFVVVAAAAGLPRLRTSKASLRHLGTFGASVISTQILYCVMRNADNVFVGRFLGATALGFYALSYRVLMLPQQTLGYMVNRVSLPVFSRLQSDRARMGNYFLHATRMIALVTFPAMALVVVGARPGIPLVFGARWRPAIVPMQILAIAGLMASVQHLTRPLLYAAGRQRLALRLQIALTMASVAGFAAGIHWGIVGVAAAVCVVVWAFGPVLIYYVGREAHISLLDYARTLTPATTACAGLVLAFAGARVLVNTTGLVAIVRLAITSLAGLGGYLAALRIMWPAEFGEARRAVALFLRRSGAPAPPARASAGQALA